MGENMDKFSDPAQHALALADSEAEAMRHPRIGSEHLILGLLGATDGLACRLLTRSGIELDRTRKAVLLTFGRGQAAEPPQRTMTLHARRVLKMSNQIAFQRGDRAVETEHLLLALLEVEKGRGAGVLDLLGVHVEELQKRVMDDLRQSKRSEKTSQSESSSTEPVGSIELEKTATVEVAELSVALRDAIRRGAEGEIPALERLLNDAIFRRFDERRARIMALLVDYERRRLELETNIAQAERELDRIETEIGGMAPIDASPEESSIAFIDERTNEGGESEDRPSAQE